MHLEALIRRGNIVRTKPNLTGPGCYQANGMFGCVWSAFGLHEPAQKQEDPNLGRSHLMHMSHWGRFRFISEDNGNETAADYVLPLVRLNWAKEPKAVTGYRQEQDFWTGVLTTDFTRNNGVQSCVKTWFDLEQKNLLCIEIEQTRGEAEVVFSAVTDFMPYLCLYKTKTTQTAAFTARENGWKIEISCADTENRRTSTLYLYTDSKGTVCADGLHIRLHEGINRLYLSYEIPCSAEDRISSRGRNETAWKAMWEKSGWMCFTDERAQQMFVRSLAYLLCSYSGPADVIQPTNGLTGNVYPFHFVQDMEYIAPALMMTGHTDIVQHWVEKFADMIPDMQKYAKHLWPEAQGVCPPWELPHGSMEGYHMPHVPIVFCYEPHNVAYLCRIAAEAAEFAGDAEWTARFALPVIRECAVFYRAFARKKEDGRWHFRWYPSVGQDEAGGRNGEDYLCSLYSAKYCFAQAVKYGMEEFDVFLKDGLAFDGLMSEMGMLHTLPGADDFGKQKHPVQLDGLTYMPTEAAPLPEELAAYNMRRKITEGADESFYFGWTLSQFLLAGANVGDAEGYRKDWAELRHANYVDEEWVQLYESSGEAFKSFYMTSHGMVLQSMIRCAVNDYWGRTEIDRCPAFGKVEYGNIVTRFGPVSS